MQAITGVFTTAEAGRAAGDRLVAAHLPGERITVLMPGASTAEVERAVPTSEGEAPGTGSAIGGVVGGAAGAATGFGAAALASVLLPGVGTIGVLGTAAAAVLGLTGVAAGVAAGDRLEDALSDGLPRDELFVYEDALRDGRSVVVALVADDDEAGRARRVLEDAGAESVDAARDRWWLGLRPAEEEAYGAPGFEADEPRYRRGFEAALGGEARGATYDEALPRLERRHAAVCRDPAFRRGYERGADYDRRMRGRAAGPGPSRRGVA
jgi:hypothetical protein